MHTFSEGPQGECTYFFSSVHRIFRPCSTLCTPIYPECSSFWLADTFCIKCAQFSAAKRPQISAPGPASGPGGRARGVGEGGGEGGGGEDSFPVNPGGAALWHPRAAAATTTTVKVVTGGGQFEERPAP